MQFKGNNGFESGQVLRCFLCPMLMRTFHLLKKCKFIEEDGLDFTFIDYIWIHN